MLKKFLAITLVVTMVFALTGCDTFGKAFDTLGDLLNGERENEKDMADGIGRGVSFFVYRTGR